MASDQPAGRRAAALLRTVVNTILILFMFGLPLFLPAGTLHYWNAWLFTGSFALFYLAVMAYFSISNPSFALSRLQTQEAERTQRIVMPLAILSCLLSFVVAGLDFRFHWSRIPLPLVLVAFALVACGYSLFFLVLKQNSFASRVVELQSNQMLIDSGAYSIVRHPMYLAATVILVFAPILLGSWYALIPALAFPALLTWRIRNEEQVLKTGLPGYDEYMKKVKYRLLPFVW
jgi:protein-S-isoprenylcysteine O-methyltransferase Ste14